MRDTNPERGRERLEHSGLSLWVCLNLVQNKQPKLESELMVLRILVHVTPTKRLDFILENPNSQRNIIHDLLLGKNYVNKFCPSVEKCNMCQKLFLTTVHKIPLSLK